MEQSAMLGNSIVDYLNGRGELEQTPYQLCLIKKDLEEIFPEASFGYSFRNRRFRIICYTNSYNIWIDILGGRAKLLSYEEVSV